MIGLVELLATLVLSIHTISFNEVTGADSYNVYRKSSPPIRWNPAWTNAPQACKESPCDIVLRDQRAGRVVYVSVVAVSDTLGEGPH